AVVEPADLSLTTRVDGKATRVQAAGVRVGEDDWKTDAPGDVGTCETPNRGEAATTAFDGRTRMARDACCRQFWTRRNAWGAALERASGGTALGAAGGRAAADA
ncbi:hypothetical protein THAOC_27249, partial [Thalassiosira oceanica]